MLAFESLKTRAIAAKRQTVGIHGANTTEQPQRRPSVRSGILKQHEDGLFLTGVVRGRPIKLLVDTGPNITNTTLLQ